MKNIIKTFLILIFALSLSACSSDEVQKIVYSIPETEKVDKIKVIDFHSSYQCYSCIYLGNMTQDILERNFPEEMKNGEIVFKKINVDEAKNRETVLKYKARGSSLFFNFIINGEDNIEEDVSVWRLIGKDKEFEDYLVNKINRNIK
jgi:thioredoxin-related protein